MIPGEHVQHFQLKLACGHRVVTTVQLRQQYPTDEHYVYCPACREDQHVAFSWNPVTSVNEVSNASLSNVLSTTPLIMPDDILRLQPSKPPNRQRPFPYIRK